MWPYQLLYEFADSAKNKASLNARIRIALDAKDFWGRCIFVGGTQNDPLVKVSILTAYSPQVAFQRNRDLTDANAENVSTTEDDIGAEFSFVFEGKSEVAYFLRELEARRLSGDRSVGEIRDTIDLKLKALPKPRPVFGVIEGGRGAAPSNP